MQAGVGDNQGRIAALEGLSTDLPSLKKLIGEQRAEFDALAFAGVSRSEAFHSKVLAWLLDPRGSHGAGEHFLRGFLLQATAQAGSARIGTGPLAVNAAFDWSATRVRREWAHAVDGDKGYLDILLLNEEAAFLCAVENKIGSSEHDEQLTRYRKALVNQYPDFDRHHVFLTPGGTLPYRTEEQRWWTPVEYSQVLRLVEETRKNSANPVPKDVGVFLQQYSTTLRRKIVSDVDTNAQQRARQIYLTHREAIEFLIENKPDLVSEMSQLFAKAIDGQEAWKADWKQPDLVFFRSADWDRFEAFKTGTGWGDFKSLVTFAFDLRQPHPRLICTLGPGTDEAIRGKIHAGISRQPGLFSCAGEVLNTSYTRLDVKEPITKDADLVDWDNPAVRAKLTNWVSAFAETDFPKMNNIIVECFQECEA